MSEFKCPTCGSGYFKSGFEDGRIATRQCKGRYKKERFGYSYAGCTYEWPVEDDAKHGLFVPEEKADE